VDEEKARELSKRLREFTLEGTTFWRERFIEWDTNEHGAPYGMYSERDEFAPFFTEAFLYNLVGKDEARSILGIIRGLCDLAEVEFR
jgi:hypothetical protein